MILASCSRRSCCQYFLSQKQLLNGATTTTTVTRALFSSTSTQAVPPSSSPPIVELREYHLHPEHAAAYMQATATAADLRKRLAPLRFFSLPETGGLLHTATHAYYYAGGHAERNAKRAAMAADPDWKAYVATIRPHAAAQHSTIYIEAPLVQTIDAITGLSQQVPKAPLPGNAPILEIRRYQLQLGYDTVPQFLEWYGGAIADKLTAPGTCETTSLVTLLYSDVGPLNEVLEIWRHGNGTAAMEQSRAAARRVSTWRQAIAQIATLAVSFQTTIHKPVSFSPIQ